MIYPVEVVSMTDSVVVVVSICGLVGYVIGSSGTSMTYPVLVVSMGSSSVLVVTSFLVVGSEVTDIAVDNMVVGNEEELKVVVVVGAYKKEKKQCSKFLESNRSNGLIGIQCFIINFLPWVAGRVVRRVGKVRGFSGIG